MGSESKKQYIIKFIESINDSILIDYFYRLVKSMQKKWNI